MDLYFLGSSYVGASAILGLWNKWKGHGFLLGFFYSLLLTPFIGVLTIALSQKVIMVQTARGVMRTCPHCFSLTSVASPFCGQCGRHIHNQTIKDFLHLGELFVALIATIIVARMLMAGVSSTEKVEKPSVQIRSDEVPRP
ncbi:MAG: hypothetical protein HY088_08975 [Ignavibacteriales bacterium]|nr:hypothetical protein [Ignavibacteriales bacterium]